MKEIETPIRPTDSEMRAFQKRNLEAAMKLTGWRVSGKGGAADLLGIRPTTLTDRLKSLGIRRPRR